MAEVPVRSGPTLLATAATSQTIHTAGAANTWAILRSIHVCSEVAAAVKVTVGVGTTNADAAGKRLVRSVTLAEGESYEWTGFLPLAGHATAPDLVYALCDTTNGATITLGLVTGP